MTHAHRAETPAAAGTPLLGVLTRLPVRAPAGTAYAQPLCRHGREAIRQGQAAWQRMFSGSRSG